MCLEFLYHANGNSFNKCLKTASLMFLIPDRSGKTVQAVKLAVAAERAKSVAYRFQLTEDRKWFSFVKKNLNVSTG